MTPLEHDCTDFAKINCKCPSGYCKLKESSRTEEIAIGFSKWKFEQGWEFYAMVGTVLYNCNRFRKEEKNDKELFSMYMESLKP